MKKLLGVPLLALVAAVLLALLPVVVSADSTVRFDAWTPLAVVGAADTQANFKLDRHGNLKEALVETTGEVVMGSGLVVSDCDPPSDPFCLALDGSTFSSVHNSRAKVTKIQFLNPYTFSGRVKGKLEGTVTIAGAGPADFMQGEMKLKIRGDAVYGCITSPISPSSLPLPIASCIEGNGKLVPVSLNVVDRGRLHIETTSGVFEDVEEAKAKVKVTVDGLVGLATISKGKAEMGDQDD